VATFIEFENLTVNLSGRRILTALTGTLSGQCVGLLGPNGAGKTTLIHTALGFHRAAEGAVRIFGLDAAERLRRLRAQIGYMPERDAFVPGMSCVRFIAMMAELSGLPPRVALERAHEALFFVGLDEARYRAVETYSLGMKQLAKLAQAIVHGPRLLILDEPTNGLDPPARRRMIELICTIRDGGKANILLSSHLLRDVERCCDEILILKDGRIAAQYDLEAERKLNRRFLEVEIRPESPVFADELRRLGCELATANNQRLKVVLPDHLDVPDIYDVASRHSVHIRRLNRRRDSLEDIFLKAMEFENGRL
jgi:ABC-2 type transport system ATP-binding protein